MSSGESAHGSGARGRIRYASRLFGLNVALICSVGTVSRPFSQRTVFRGPPRLALHLAAALPFSADHALSIQRRTALADRQPLPVRASRHPQTPIPPVSPQRPPEIKGLAEQARLPNGALLSRPPAFFPEPEVVCPRLAQLPPVPGLSAAVARALEREGVGLALTL